MCGSTPIRTARLNPRDVVRPDDRGSFGRSGDARRLSWTLARSKPVGCSHSGCVRERRARVSACITSPPTRCSATWRLTTAVSANSRQDRLRPMRPQRPPRTISCGHGITLMDWIVRGTIVDTRSTRPDSNAKLPTPPARRNRGTGSDGRLVSGGLYLAGLLRCPTATPHDVGAGWRSMMPSPALALSRPVKRRGTREER